MVSRRGEAAIRQLSAYQNTLIHLPDSTINLATAENKLSLPAVTALLNKIPSIKPAELTYTSMHGSPEMLEALSTFLSRHLQVTVPKDTITVTSGVSASLDVLAHALAEEGDFALTPSPCYRGLGFLFSSRSGVQLLTAKSDSSFPPRLTVDQINSAWEEAGGASSRIKILLLVNPDNPTGVVRPLELVLELVHWARQRGLHVIVDECYALSTHDQSFKSVLSMLEPCDDVHVVWGVSKDFALPGIRIGAVITHNKQLQQALHTNLAYFSTSSRLAQHAIRHILPLMDEEIEANRQRLKQSCKFAKSRLKRMGAEVVDSAAGFFLWVKFSKWVADEAEEERLWQRFCKLGVLILPGSEAYAGQPGCFRICYTGVDVDTLEEGLERIQSVLQHGEVNGDGVL